MNRFLAKKKGKDDAPPSRPSMEGDSTSHFKLFGKTSCNFSDNGKKAPDQGKSVLDLSKALPSSDDFRTSLLMTGLSARFSMLREVDDQAAKASKPGEYDVPPKQTQSILSEEHIHPEALRDQSDRDSPKTGLLGDLDSLTAEEAAPATTSIMNRGKPMEGNNLFGGRQKVYRVPASGTAAAKDGHMPGRALYDQDVPLSGFQKWKQSEKEEQMAPNAQADAAEEANSQATPTRVEDISTTTTTTTIAPEPRMPQPEPGVSTPAPLAQRKMSVKDPQSTTATTNQEAPATDRFVSRAKRLYEQGLNQELADQQTSAFSRMDSLSKTRAFAPMTPEMPSPSSSLSGDRRQAFAKASAPNLRAVIPNGAAELKSSSGMTPPLSPPISESDGQSSIQRQRSNASLVTTRRHIPTDIQTTSFFDDSDAMPLPAQSGGLSRTPSLSIERPLDEDHPAFRKNAPPTPSSLMKVSEESTVAALSNGLSSMVRAHLRSESTASSVFEDHEEAQNGHNGSARGTSPASGKQTASRTSCSADDEASREQDEFARHLADGARRVREKLTSYVDADPDRATPLPSSPIETPRELNPPRPTLGLLRSKSSRSSLFDRESREQGRSLRVNISAASIAAALPSPRRLTAETDEPRGSTNQADDEASDGVSVGLKAFRQARRELQKVKEVESPQKPPPGPPRPLAMRAMSYEPSAPQAPPSAAVYTRMPRGESRNGMGSRSGSRAPSERDRSGSDTSTGGIPSRMRTGSVAHDERLPGSASGSVRRPPMNMGPDSRPRTGSKASTPPTSTYGSLPAATGAPPLPPLNPRRINGLKGDEESPAAPSRMPGGFPMGEGESDDEGAAESRHQRLRRATSEGNSLHSRARTSRPRNESRPPLPQGFPNARFPGGMI